MCRESRGKARVTFDSEGSAKIIQSWMKSSEHDYQFSTIHQSGADLEYNFSVRAKRNFVGGIMKKQFEKVLRSPPEKTVLNLLNKTGECMNIEILECSTLLTPLAKLDSSSKK